MTELESRLESILFVAGEPVALTALCAGLETDPDTLGKAICGRAGGCGCCIQTKPRS